MKKIKKNEKIRLLGKFSATSEQPVKTVGKYALRYEGRWSRYNIINNSININKSY